MSKKKPIKISDYSFGQEIAYCAYYKNKPYAISEIKERVVHYMEEFRFCTNYEIRAYDLDHVALISNHDLYLYNYNDIYVTERDIIMSKLYTSDVDSDIDKLYDNLYSLVRKMGQIGKKEKKISKIIDTLNVLTMIKADSDYMFDLQVINELDNDIIYCPIDRYIKHVQKYEEYTSIYDKWFYED